LPNADPSAFCDEQFYEQIFLLDEYRLRQGQVQIITLVV
jgi:hypothetical protein